MPTGPKREPDRAEGVGAPLRKSTSIRSIAEAAGVHPSTVSRALQGTARDRRINELTVERIRAIASELGYEPDPWARALRTKRSMTVGLLMPQFTDALLMSLLEAVEDRVREHGFQTITASTRDRVGEEASLVRMFLERKADGIILATATLDDPVPGQLEREEVPFVLMNRASGEHPTVSGDDVTGGLLVTEHLLALGHRRIGFISGLANVSTSKLRREGYERAHSARGVPVDPELTVGSSFDEVGGRLAADVLMRLADPPTALVCVNDPTAIGAMYAIRERGLDVPRDIAVTGYNDSLVGRMLSVPLTTVRLDLRSMGFAASDMVVQRIDGGTAETRLIEPELIIRRSSRA